MQFTIVPQFALSISSVFLFLSCQEKFFSKLTKSTRIFIMAISPLVVPFPLPLESFSGGLVY